jgi:NADPH:quinone reductase
MRRVRFERFGDPRDVLRVEEVPPPPTQPGEVLVRMRARPINPADLLTVRGLYGALPAVPATPGNEGMGVVESVGPGVNGLQAGQRVIPLRTPGTWQELLAVKASSLVPVPDSLGDESAAQFVVNPLSVWIIVTQELALEPGQWLLQTAAGSSLGHIVRQVAGLRGVRTINVVRRREQADELRAQGAGEVICTADEDLGQRVMAITGGVGVPAAIDAVGGEVGGDVVRVLAPGGVMLVYGLLSLEPTPIHGGQMVFRGTSVRGFWLAAWLARASAEQQRGLIREVLGHMAKGAIAPPVEAAYDLGDVMAAVDHAERPGRRGKVLLVG